MEHNDNLLGVLATLYKWRRPLAMLCAAAAIGTAVITIFMPTYYRATTTFFAASPDQTRPELIYSQGVSMRTEYFGNANDIDRMLTIAESNDLLTFLVDSFDLYAHYKIDSGHYKAPFYMREQFFSLYQVKKTKRDAMEVSVEDTDPELAARIANASRDKIEQIARSLIRESQAQTIKTYQENIEHKERLLMAIGDSVARARSRYGVYNAVAQGEALTAQMSEARALFARDSVRLQVLRANSSVPRDTIYLLDAKVAGLRQEIRVIGAEIDRFNSGIAEVYLLEKQYLEANQALGEDRERLKRWQAAYHSSAPALLLVEAAETPVIKSRPRRSILVAAATMAALLLGVIGVLLLDAYKTVNWRQVLDESKS